jgi:hypothetical protein
VIADSPAEHWDRAAEDELWEDDSENDYYTSEGEDY